MTSISSTLTIRSTGHQPAMRVGAGYLKRYNLSACNHLVEMNRSERSTIAKILEIDKLLKEKLTDYARHSQDLSFNEVGIINKINHQTIANLKYSGLYMFEISSNGEDCFSSWLNKFRPIWEDDRYKKSFTPNTRKKRTAAHINKPLAEWIPLYIGKSKNVGSRIIQHLEIEMDQPTNALKLNNRDNISEYNFRISTIEIGIYNYDSLMFISESMMREKFNPITGKQ